MPSLCLSLIKVIRILTPPAVAHKPSSQISLYKLNLLLLPSQLILHFLQILFLFICFLPPWDQLFVVMQQRLASNSSFPCPQPLECQNLGVHYHANLQMSLKLLHLETEKHGLSAKHHLTFHYNHQLLCLKAQNPFPHNQPAFILTVYLEVSLGSAH